MNFSEYKRLIFSDLYRLEGCANFRKLLRHVILGDAYWYIFWMRTVRYLKGCKLYVKIPFYSLVRIMLRHVTYKLGISIPSDTEIGAGFYIGHFGGIIVNDKCIIGDNCNLSHGVTLGQANRGKMKGSPKIGNNVYIGPGAKIVGAVQIGNDVAIGANCVVTKDIPEHSVVVGIPGVVISDQGSVGYINRVDYDAVL